MKKNYFFGVVLGMTLVSFVPCAVHAYAMEELANEAADGFCRTFMKTWIDHESIPVRAEGAVQIPNEKGVYTVSCHNTDSDRNHIFNAEIKVTFSSRGALDSLKLSSIIE